MSAALLLCLGLMANPEVPLSSLRAIVIADDAPDPDRHAAAELRDYLRWSAGRDLDIIAASTVQPGQRYALVGDSAALRRLVPSVDLTGLGPDGIVISTAGGHLALAGTPPRGAAYAVYSFLEDTLGIRWWTSSEQTVPRHRNFVVPPQDVHYTPALRLRESFYTDALDGLFGLRLKHNGHFVRTPEELGGHDGIIGWCHTFYLYLPPGKYFAAHPEWYAEADGVRQHAGRQLCLTNEESRVEMARVMRQYLLDNPGMTMISLSHNDWGGWCRCAKCSALVAAEGSDAGPLLQYVNAVAGMLADEFPHVLVETLAYQGSRRPPATVRPADNVVVRLCSIECDFGQPLATGPRNADFAADTEGWSKIAPRMVVWNYVTNFANYLLPHPNLTPLADDIRWFIDHGAVGLFEQGDYGSRTGDFVGLRGWLLAHLMWDPSRSQPALIDEFLRGYYGAAAPFLREYLQLREDARDANDTRIGCYRGNVTDWLDLAGLTRATQLFEQAEAAVAGQPEYLLRVQRERLPLTLVWIMNDPALRRQTAAEGLEWAGPADTMATWAEWRALHEHYNVGQAHEGRPFADWADGFEAQIERDAVRAARRAANPNPNDWQEYDLTLYREGEMTSIVADPAATNGEAARMTTNHTEWAIQAPIGTEVAGKRVHLRVALRADAANPADLDGVALDYGVWDFGGGGVVGGSMALADVAGPQYKTLDLGEVAITPGCAVWVAPKNNPGQVGAIYVDRVWYDVLD